MSDTQAQGKSVQGIGAEGDGEFPGAVRSECGARFRVRWCEEMRERRQAEPVSRSVAEPARIPQKR